MLLLQKLLSIIQKRPQKLLRMRRSLHHSHSSQLQKLLQKLQLKLLPQSTSISGLLRNGLKQLNTLVRKLRAYYVTAVFGVKIMLQCVLIWMKLVALVIRLIHITQIQPQRQLHITEEFVAVEQRKTLINTQTFWLATIRRYFYALIQVTYIHNSNSYYITGKRLGLPRPS